MSLSIAQSLRDDEPLRITQSLRNGLHISADDWVLTRKRSSACWSKTLVDCVYRQDAGEHWLDIVNDTIETKSDKLSGLIFDLFCSPKLNWETLSRHIYIIAKEAFYTNVHLYVNISADTTTKNCGVFDTSKINDYKGFLVQSQKTMMSIFPCKDIANIVLLYL
jgi:hypothetical protein